MVTTRWPLLEGLLVVACALSWPVQARAEELADVRSFENRAICSVVFDPPAQPLAPAELNERVRLKVNGRFTEDLLRASIADLFRSGRYADIAVDGQLVGGQVALRFVTKRSFFLGDVQIDGLKTPPNESQTIAAARLSLGAPFHESDRRAATEAIENELRRNGFYHPSIVSEVIRKEETSEASLHFRVEPGPRARFGPPAFNGELQRPERVLVRATHWQRLYGILGWEPVTALRVQQGLDNIRNVYQKSGNLRTRVALEQLRYREDRNVVDPVVRVDVGPRITVQVRGFRLSKAQLRRLLPIYQERTVDRDLLVEGQQNIRQYLESKGYFETTVEYRIGRDGDRRTIVYVVERGPRHKLARLLISGNRYFSLDTLRERMLVRPAGFPQFPRGRFGEELLQRDLIAVADLYQSNGFRDVRITHQLQDDYLGKRNNLALTIRIVEGTQSLVSELNVEGVGDTERAYLRTKLQSSAGQPFSAVNVAADQDTLLNYFYDNGFPNCTLDYYLDQQGPARLAIRFVVHPGPRRYVGRILLSGLDLTKPKLVRSRIQLAPGEPLSFAKNTESQRRLYDLGIFARVNTALQNPDGDEQSKAVLYDFEEAKHYSLNFGLGAEIARIGGGVTTLDAPAGTTGFSPRVSFGVSRINLLGIGQTLALQTRVSNLEQRAVLTHFIPEFIGSQRFSSTASLVFDNSNDVRTFTARRREASIQLAQKLSKANSLQYRLVFRRVTQSNLKVEQLLVPLLSQPERVGLIGISFVQDKRDDPTDAHEGLYTTIDASYAPQALASQTEFARVLARNASYHRLTRQVVFARNTQFGIIQRVAGRLQTPLPERFFSGGSTSMRAFPDFQAGPRDLQTGFPLGGNALLLNQSELRFPLVGDNIGGVLFHDAGNVYTDVGSISFRFRQENLQDFDYMVHSFGFGLRYRTPIGPFRVDLSLSPDAPRFFGLKGTVSDFLNGTAEPRTQKINAFQFHISLGQAF